jgi:hypothetical protein
MRRLLSVEEIATHTIQSRQRMRPIQWYVGLFGPMPHPTLWLKSSDVVAQVVLNDLLATPFVPDIHSLPADGLSLEDRPVSVKLNTVNSNGRFDIYDQPGEITLDRRIQRQRIPSVSVYITAAYAGGPSVERKPKKDEWLKAFLRLAVSHIPCPLEPARYQLLAIGMQAVEAIEVGACNCSSIPDQFWTRHRSSPPVSMSVLDNCLSSRPSRQLPPASETPDAARFGRGSDPGHRMPETKRTCS